MFFDVVNFSSGSYWDIIGFTQISEQQRNKTDSVIHPIPEVYAATALAPKRFRTSPGESGYILSTASLNDVSSLRIRRHNGRCIGLFLRYNDSASEALGQWDPLDQDSISQLYDATDGILMRLNFHTASEVYNDFGWTRLIIKNITVEVTDNPWDYQGSAGQPAGTDPLIKVFDCFSLTRGLHGGLIISMKTCLSTTTGPECPCQQRREILKGGNRRSCYWGLAMTSTPTNIMALLVAKYKARN